jgi:hypothetical protein
MRLTKIFVLLSYLGMVLVNFLANALPINNVATGAVSDSYPNLFAPAGLTFSIWGLIYLLLSLFVLYQFNVFGNVKKHEKVLEKIRFYFIISSLANISWLFCWHYDAMWLSLFFMGLILFSLIKIAECLHGYKLKREDYFLMKLPFSVYLGWITVATIANVTVFLVSVNWNGFGISEIIWTIIVLLIGATIGILATLKNKDVAYASVLVWAYLGILLKHVSTSGFASQYPSIIFTVILCVFLFTSTILYLIYKKLI